MSSKKIIAVVGATGAQGGGLVRAILNDPSGGFTARAITRDVKSDKARALAALGAEVVPGDVDDEASLHRAFSGAHGAYCVTFFWAHFSPEKEKAEAAAMREQPRLRVLSMQSGRPLRILGNECRFPTTGCQRYRAIIKCLTSTPKGKRTQNLFGVGFPLRSC